MRFTTIGSDPEFFVLDPKGKPYPATKFAIGTKVNPVPIVSLPTGFFEQRDNLSFEGNIPVCTTKKEFISNITSLRNYFKSKISGFNYSISSNGVEYFEKRYLNLAEALEFGCSSVISSWSSRKDYIASMATPILNKARFRVAGFHLHIGYKDVNIPKEYMDIIIGRLFDLFLTIPSHIIKPEPERIKTYGKWGMIRSKSYGVECRTLSTYFTQEEHLGWVWDQMFKIEEFINNTSKQDLEHMIERGYFLGYNSISAKRQFSSMFSGFKNKEVLNMFNETKEVCNDEKYVNKNISPYRSILSTTQSF